MTAVPPLIVITGSLILIAVVLIAVLVAMGGIGRRRSSQAALKQQPLTSTTVAAPRALPIIGHLHLLGGYKVPYEAFSVLGDRYGPVVPLQLGRVQCVVVNGAQLIRDVLTGKGGHHFDARPSFQRYHHLFSGNKENSLAFCDWSQAQKVKRDMLKPHTFPKSYTSNFKLLESLISVGAEKLVTAVYTDSDTDVKSMLLTMCANVFLSYFASVHFTVDNAKFQRMIDDYDHIFYEVNQGYLADFLPFLLPFHTFNLRRIRQRTERIRAFMIAEVVQADRTIRQPHTKDYVDALLESVADGDFTMDQALFALEDIIGGHSAVANFVTKVLGHVANEPLVQDRLYAEITANGSGYADMANKHAYPYTQAVIYEAIRLIASPIVPRVAGEDGALIDGVPITKGCVIFLNNYELSMSPQLWQEPTQFRPERFLNNDTGTFKKPDHFMPFGGGRRQCMGYKLVHMITFGVLTALFGRYRIHSTDGGRIDVPAGSLALPRTTFYFRFSDASIPAPDHANA